MNRRIFILLALLLLLSGCANRVSAAESQADETVPAARSVLGKIKEINGNEILLALAEQSEPPRGDPGERADIGVPPGAEGAVEEQPQTGVPSPDASRQPDGSGRPSGDMPAEGSRGGGDSPPSDQQQAPAGGANASGGGSGGARGNRQGGRGGQSGNAVSVTLTGEEKTWLIPVTADVSTGEGETKRTIRFTQLAVKNVVRLQLDANDNIIAVEVLG